MSDLSPSELDRRRSAVRQFIRDNWFINKTITAESSRDSDRTAKAFALYYLSSRQARDMVVGLDPAEVAAATMDLEGALERQWEAIKRQREAIKCGETSDTNTDVGVLPNSYASAVIVAGYLRVGNSKIRDTNSKTENTKTEQLETTIEAAIDWMTERINKPDGFIPSLYEGSVQPSAYLTFWCAAALCEWQIYLSERKRDTEIPSLKVLRSWSRRRLRDMLAYHHGGLRPQFDIIETVYASATVLMASDNSDDRTLVQHALSVLFESYFDRGSLEASAPVFTDETHLSVQISTAEALATIFLVDREGSIMDRHLSSVRSTYEWVRDHRIPEKGWYPEGQGRANIPNAYATASATRFLAEYARMLDNRLDRNLRAELGISQFVEDPELEGVTYPVELGLLIKQTIIDPIKNDKRKIASYSMLLYGPPGTSKTTIAELVSRDLRWPLKKLGTGSFTHKGRAGIDQAAAELFERLGYLKDVVVLFDEVEELVGERLADHADMESRLLTTAMLPRLQELRKRRQVVFILATNLVDRIDAAIKRLGRFDIVRCVLPPTEDVKQQMLNKIVERYKLTEEVRQHIFELEIAKDSDGFCYGDLDAFVREIAILAAKACTKEELRALIKRVFKHAQSRALSKKDLKPYEESSEKYDRPSWRTP